MVLDVDLHFLFRRQGSHDGGHFESADIVVRHKYLKDDLFVGVILQGGGSLGDFSNLQSAKIYLVAGHCEVGFDYFTTIMDIDFVGGDLPSNNFTSYVVFLSVVLAVL